MQPLSDLSEDGDALGDLYQRHGGAVYGFVLHLLRDQATAEEVTQEVFLNVWRKANSYRQDRGTFYTWVMTMAHHRAIDELRRSRRQRATLEEATREAAHVIKGFVDSAADQALKAGDAELVRKALDVLPPEQRTVITLAYFQGFSQSEIAVQLEQPLGTVKTRMRFAMQKLRTALSDQRESL